MTDLLERLRMRCACVSDRDPCPRCKQEFEAANEIERLNAALTRLEAHLELARQERDEALYCR